MRERGRETHTERQRQRQRESVCVDSPEYVYQCWGKVEVTHYRVPEKGGKETEMRGVWSAFVSFFLERKKYFCFSICFGVCLFCVSMAVGTTMLTNADGCWCWRMLTFRCACCVRMSVGTTGTNVGSAAVCVRWRMLTYADVCWRMLTHAVCVCL